MSSSSSSMEWRLEAFEPRTSLWKLIEQSVPGGELSEIKEVLGEDLVDETLDLQNEVRTLLDIWCDYREETEKEERENALTVHQNKLPEPPMVRENLKREILLFAEMLRQKAEEDGRKPFSSLTSQESELLDYASENQARHTSDAIKRPSTARSTRDGRQTPMRATPSSDGRSSRCASPLTDCLETVSEQLNALEIDRIGENLRQLLREEREGLCEDITFLQESLMDESEYRQQVTTFVNPEPSLKDLRDLGTKLEKEMLKNNASLRSMKNDRKLKVFRNTSLEEENQDFGSANCVTADRGARQAHTAGTSSTVGAAAVGLHNSHNKHGQYSPSPSSLPKHEPHSPSPPSSAKPSRPGSSHRFRRLVPDCRDSVR